ncbi:MAG: TrkH family potassium uptake protein, partial [Thermomicrobiales bacterium]
PAPPSVHSHAIRFIIALLLFIGVGALLLCLPFSHRAEGGNVPLTALFTAISAGTVTGLSVVDTRDHWTTFGQIVILILVQFGGLSFAVGATLLLQIMRRGDNIGLRDELLMRDGSPALSLREAVTLSSRIIRYTIVAEIIGTVLLTVRFAADMPPGSALWAGLFHAVAAFCNGGFDLQGGLRSMTPYRDSVWINLIIIVLVQAGSIGFLAIDDLLTARRWTRLTLDSKLILGLNAVLVLAGTLFFLAVEWHGALASTPAVYRPMTALFQSVSARSAGFTTIDWSQADPVTLFFWLGLMLVGGASGSTSGGVRLATIGVLLVAIVAAVRGADDPQAFRRRLPLRIVGQALAIVAIFTMFHFIFSIALAVIEDGLGGEHLPFINLMFETMSALATTG